MYIYIYIFKTSLRIHLEMHVLMKILRLVSLLFICSIPFKQLFRRICTNPQGTLNCSRFKISVTVEAINLYNTYWKLGHSLELLLITVKYGIRATRLLLPPTSDLRWRAATTHHQFSFPTSSSPNNASLKTLSTFITHNIRRHLYSSKIVGNK